MHYRSRGQTLTLNHNVNAPHAKGIVEEAEVGVEDDAVALVWLVSALDYARGQSRIEDYLQSVANDVVFETEMAARRASLLSRVR